MPAAIRRTTSGPEEISIRRAFIFAAVIAAASTFAGCGHDPATGGNATSTVAPGTKPVWLQQGWNDVQRQWFYHAANQGSHLVPYDWFLWLEQVTGGKLLRDNEHIEALRFLSEPEDPATNPDGLPVGFVKDEVPDAQNRIWLGLTCAACHTCQINYQGAPFRIDGGPGQGDIQTLLEEISAALTRTHDDDATFARFAKHILNDQSNDAVAQKQLRDALAEVAQYRREFQQRNATTHRYGFARVDAFGIIMNEALQHALQVPANGREPNAPVSYPFLWDTPQHDFVQWNGVAPNRPLGTHIVGPLSRNLGEVLGVFGDVTVASSTDALDGYSSSARRLNLIVIEELLKQLKSPQWPTSFPPIDTALAAKGRALYEAHCASCHHDIDRADSARSVRAAMTPLDKLGTDPLMANNFSTRVADPGPLRGQKKLFIIGDAFGASAPAGEVLVRVIAGAIIHRPFDEPSARELLNFETLLGGHGSLDAAIKSHAQLRDNVMSNSDQVSTTVLKPLETFYKLPRDDGALAYKGRPLNGIWATGPFLHNGSVPNLEQLLMPAKDRVDHFYVGSREFDPDKVGFKSDQGFDGAFEFRVNDDMGKPIPGNSNAGHEYGTTLTPDERRQLLEYLKSI